MLRVNSVQPAKDTKGSRVASAYLGNDAGTTVKVEAWRGNADRLVSLLKQNQVVYICLFIFLIPNIFRSAFSPR